MDRERQLIKNVGKFRRWEKFNVFEAVFVVIVHYLLKKKKKKKE